MHVLRILHSDQLGVGDLIAEFCRCCIAVSKQARPECGINPGPGHHVRTIGRGDGIAQFDIAANVCCCDDALLDQQLFQGDAKDLVIAVHLVVGLWRRMWMVVIMVVVMMIVIVILRAHASFSSQCSARSASMTSWAGPL